MHKITFANKKEVDASAWQQINYGSHMEHEKQTPLQGEVSLCMIDVRGWHG
jgi:hypothetical protein